MPSHYGLSIRTADGGDSDGLIELFTAADIAVTGERLAARLNASSVEPGAVLIAEEWGPPSGVIAVHWRTSLTAELKVGWISLLLVAPERRRGGVARLLLKAAAQAARSAGCGELALITPGQKPDLHAFCIATGFAEAGDGLARPLRKRG